MARSTYEDFIVKDKIGSGSYGIVFKVIRKVDRMTYAMKEIDLQGMSRKEQEECIRETRVLSSLDSDYIIKYYDSFLERGKLYIITEYAGNGNLHDYIKKQKNKLPEELIWRLFVQILMGLNHMHSRKILHRDIKTLNVFLDDDLNVKLGDMGVAKILSTHTNFAKTIVGTPYYLSPELCEDKPYNEKSDVWALGVVLYECCTQRHPFDADNQGALILKILRGKYPPISGYSPDISDVIKRCLTQNANRRPNTYKLLLLPCVRQKAEELGMALPDQQTLLALAERAGALKKSNSGRPASGRPSSARSRPPPAADSDNAAAVAAVRQLPPQPGQGEIRVVGDMDAPPSAPVSTDNIERVSSGGMAANADKAFVFGGTMKAGVGAGSGAPGGARPAQAVDVAVSVSGVEATPGDVAGSGEGAPGPLEAGWRVAEDGADGDAGSVGDRASAGTAETPSTAGGRPTAWGLAGDMAGLGLEDDEGEEEDDSNNPYHNPHAYRDPDDPDYAEDGEEGEEEGEEDYEGGEGEEVEEEFDDEAGYDSQGAGGSSGGWQPDPVRLQHMRSAMMIQRAACLDLIGEKAFNELYALLKSNQVDEASMTDLSRLVFKIIPYDKSEVIQMMYKLLYLESQLEGGQ